MYRQIDLLISAFHMFQLKLEEWITELNLVVKKIDIKYNLSCLFLFSTVEEFRKVLHQQNFFLMFKV